jgi:hypothetical protein
LSRVFCAFFSWNWSGIVASVKTQIGSHFEGFASLTDETLCLD